MVYIRPGRKLKLLVFSCTGSNVLITVSSRSPSNMEAGSRYYLSCQFVHKAKQTEKSKTMVFMSVELSVCYYLSRCMGKPTICIGENKDADQLCSKREADQRHYFCYTDSTSSTIYIQNFKLLAAFCDCTAWFVSDLVRPQIVGFLMHRLI